MVIWTYLRYRSEFHQSFREAELGDLRNKSRKLRRLSGKEGPWRVEHEIGYPIDRRCIDLWVT